jgi:pyruvate/2-oxoacid:ferredoxin oxidoreductase beta subunit
VKKVIEGSHAVSEAARLARVEVIAAYPITPQTHIVEALSDVFPLYEVEGGVDYTLNFKGDLEVKGYLSAQGRFKHLTDADYQRIQQMTNAEWKLLLRKAGLGFCH